MLPFLFQNSSFETPTYYVLYLLSFLAAIILATRTSSRYQLSPVRAVDLGIVAFTSGIIGSRLFHIFFEAPHYYREHPIRIFYLWQGGFVLYGGLIVGFLACYYFLRRYQEPVRLWADAVAPCILLGIAIGRIGCLAAGCCYGHEADGFWGMVFTHPGSAAPLNIPIHPTQILESFGTFILAGIHYWALRKPPRIHGTGFISATLSYCVLRFMIEFLRGDPERGFLFNGLFSTSQFISLLVIAASVTALVYLHRRGKEP